MRTFSPADAALRGGGSKLVSRIALLALYADCVGGPARFVLSKAGAAFAVYLPFGLVFALVPFQLQAASREGADLRELKAVIAFLAISAVIGVAFGRSAVQSGLSLYTWCPFLLGIMFAAGGDEETLSRHALLLWLVCVAGILYESRFDPPWSGGSYETMGVTRDIARSWEASGVKRLSGFARASYTAADQIALFGLLLMDRARKPLVAAAVAAGSLYALFLTTSKGPLAAFAVAAGFFAIYRMGKTPGFRRKVAIAAVSLGMAVMVGLPIMYSGAMNIDESSVEVGSADSFLNLYSVVERMVQMWPDAFRLISRDEQPFEWILGRGPGGIGFGQIFDERDLQNFGDNMFVYLFVTCGVGCAFFGALILKGLSRTLDIDPVLHRRYAPVAVYVTYMGITACVIETVCPLFFLGVVSGLAFHARPGRGEGPW
jgi:hypothetical protein